VADLQASGKHFCKLWSTARLVAVLPAVPGGHNLQDRLVGDIVDLSQSLGWLGATIDRAFLKAAVCSSTARLQPQRFSLTVIMAGRTIGLTWEPTDE
jgi:hypothetical protein